VTNDYDGADDFPGLPVMTYHVYTFEDQTTGVTIQYTPGWPDALQVRITPQGRGIEMAGVVGADGRIRSIAVEATGPDEEVTSSALRGPTLISALKELNAMGRDLAQQMLNGVDQRKTVVDAKPATDALRALLFTATRRTAATRRRGADAEALIRDVADAYRDLVAQGDPQPRETLRLRFGYSNAHIGRLLTQARKPRNGKPPLLGPARPGKAGEIEDSADAE
jgi:hypothetical protein